jgi:dTDP-4-amino-4,6-dideoxygalactose transaminase
VSYNKFAAWPSFTQEEADVVQKVLLSNKVNYWTGQEGREFENEFSDWVGVDYSIAVANGTLALDLSLKALGVGAGDDVVVTPRTFLASVSSIVTAGATPIFADVDLNSQNITAQTISDVLTPNTKAVIVVHLAGMPADMDPIMSLAEERNFFVIEDCAQAHGARYKGRSVGSIGHVAAWSFCQDKIMTTGGEGGMVTTRDEKIWSTMWSYKDHGKSYDAVYNRAHPSGFRWLHETFGTNWRLTEMQSAIGRVQLKRMTAWSKSRVENAARIDAVAIKYKALRVVDVSVDFEHAEYKHYIFIRPEQLHDGWSRDRIINEMVDRGIPCFQGTCSEVYLEKAFENTEFKPRIRLKNAEELGRTSLMFLVHPTLTQGNIEDMCKTLSYVMSKASL